MGAPESKWVNGATGANLVFHDEASEDSWIDAIGRDVRKWELRYGADFTTGIEFTNTAVGASTVVQGVTAGCRALMTTAAAENNGNNLQLVGTPFQLASNKPLYFGAKVTLGTAAGSDLFVGLGSTDTSLVAAHVMATAGSAVGIISMSAATFTAYNEIHANEVNTLTSVARDTNAHVLEFYYDGYGNIKFYIDRALVATHTTYIPTVVMAPAIVLQSSAGGLAETCKVDWMRCIQIV
jgi:hypothetical protein